MDMSNLMIIPDAPRTSGTDYPRLWVWQIIDQSYQYNSHHCLRFTANGNDVKSDNESTNTTDEFVEPEDIEVEGITVLDKKTVADVRGHEEAPEVKNVEINNSEADNGVDETINDEAVDSEVADVPQNKMVIKVKIIIFFKNLISLVLASKYQ